MPTPQDLKEGDTVSWNWGQGKPQGTVQAVNTEKTTIKSKNGNNITRDGTEDNPAVEIKQKSGNPVLKKASELNEVTTE
ncbi:hypothetical protein HGRIS_003629 [Hohenbuehelia grisea]|uniref:Hypervirulence associated protein TUDOR domain-containing protein n=1 Tax=Hohenbuehelia grisea TaxID=104357 RepID=A0ABR3JG27_9AGAR